MNLIALNNLTKYNADDFKEPTSSTLPEPEITSIEAEYDAGGIVIDLYEEEGQEEGGPRVDSNLLLFFIIFIL